MDWSCEFKNNLQFFFIISRGRKRTGLLCRGLDSTISSPDGTQSCCASVSPSAQWSCRMLLSISSAMGDLPGLTQTSDGVNQFLWYLLTRILTCSLQSSQTSPCNMNPTPGTKPTAKSVSRRGTSLLETSQCHPGGWKRKEDHVLPCFWAEFS